MAQTEPIHIGESIIYNYRVFMYCVTRVFRWNLINNEVKYMEDEKILRPNDTGHLSQIQCSVYPKVYVLPS
jgi:hypothetical protein